MVGEWHNQQEWGCEHSPSSCSVPHTLHPTLSSYHPVSNTLGPGAGYSAGLSSLGMATLVPRGQQLPWGNTAWGLPTLQLLRRSARDTQKG